MFALNEYFIYWLLAIVPELFRLHFVYTENEVPKPKKLHDVWDLTAAIIFRTSEICWTHCLLFRIYSLTFVSLSSLAQHENWSIGCVFFLSYRPRNLHKLQTKGERSACPSPKQNSRTYQSNQMKNRKKRQMMWMRWMWKDKFLSLFLSEDISHFSTFDVHIFRIGRMLAGYLWTLFSFNSAYLPFSVRCFSLCWLSQAQNNSLEIILARLLTNWQIKVLFVRIIIGFQQKCWNVKFLPKKSIF